MRCGRCNRHRLRDRDGLRYCIGCGWEYKGKREAIKLSKELKRVKRYKGG